MARRSGARHGAPPTASARSSLVGICGRIVSRRNCRGSGHKGRKRETAFVLCETKAGSRLAVSVRKVCVRGREVVAVVIPGHGGEACDRGLSVHGDSCP